MSSVSDDNFGPLVAYLIPGATALAGLSPMSATLRGWFAVSQSAAPTIGGFLYLTVASLAAGMTVSAIRWAVIDTLHARTGLPSPKLDFSRLGGSVEAFELLINIHYRHYQFYANMLVAGVIAYVGYRLSLNENLSFGWPDIAFVALEAVFFATSRDTLQKYFIRGEQLLSAGHASPTDTTKTPPIMPAQKARVPASERSQPAKRPRRGRPIEAE